MSKIEALGRRLCRDAWKNRTRTISRINETLSIIPPPNGEGFLRPLNKLTLSSQTPKQHINCIFSNLYNLGAA